MTAEWTFQVNPTVSVPEQVWEALRKMVGKRVTLSLKQYRKTRSTPQNAYYWGVVIPAILAMFRESGNDADAEDVHEFLKMRVGKLAQAYVLPGDKVQRALGSTRKLTTMEFEVYLIKCRAFAAEYGVMIPEPHEEISA